MSQQRITCKIVRIDTRINLSCMQLTNLPHKSTEFLTITKSSLCRRIFYVRLYLNCILMIQSWMFSLWKKNNSIMRHFNDFRPAFLPALQKISSSFSKKRKFTTPFSFQLFYSFKWSYSFGSMQNYPPLKEHCLITSKRILHRPLIFAHSILVVFQSSSIQRFWICEKNYSISDVEV